MTTITKNNFKELAEVHDLHCISIFMPTHKAGDEVFQRKDALFLKNQLKDIKSSLSKRGVTPVEIEQLIQPLQDLIDDRGYWSQLSDGLAIFRTDNFFKKYELPLKFLPKVNVSHEFYLSPLIPLIMADESFFLFKLELERLQLFRGSRFGFTEINIEDIVPSGFKEVVGSDYEQKTLQARSQQGGKGHSIFHGHGEGKDERKTEIKKYLRAIDKGLMSKLNREQIPLVVAGVEFLFSAFSEICTYPHLYPEYITTELKLVNSASLHKKALDLLEPFFNKTRNDRSELYRQFQGTPRTANSIDMIVPAAIDGKIDTLFIQKDFEVSGIYNKARNKVETGKKSEYSEVSLYNLAGVQSFLHGANVFLVEKNEIPDGFSSINALFRY
jgi:hypothetical protein